MKANKIIVFFWATLLSLVLFIAPLSATTIGEHRGSVGSANVTWESVLEAERGTTIEFVNPLPVDANVNLRESDMARDEQGRIIQITMPSFPIYLSITGASLDPPLAIDVPQRVVLSGDELRYRDLDPSRFERRLGYVRQQRVTDVENERLKELGDVEMDELAIHVRPGPDDATIIEDAVQRESSSLATHLLLLLSLGVGAVGTIVFFALKKAAIVEEADEIMGELNSWDT